MHSDPVNLSTNARRKLDAARPVREAAINNAIYMYSASPTDRPFNISEMEHALLRKKDTAPSDDGCTYSMTRQYDVPSASKVKKCTQLSKVARNFVF